MKKIAFIAATALLALGFQACDSKSELAKNLEGTWGTNTRMLANSDALQTSVVDMLQFNTPEGISDPLGGGFVMTSMVAVNTMAPASDMLVQPYSISVSGIASIEGDWTVIDDDEVAVNVNPATFKVQIDPRDVVVEDNILSGENRAFTDSVAPALAENVKSQIEGLLKQHFTSIRKIDDIHIKKSGVMKCEINDVDLQFHRQ